MNAHVVTLLEAAQGDPRVTVGYEPGMVVQSTDTSKIAAAVALAKPPMWPSWRSEIPLKKRWATTALRPAATEPIARVLTFPGCS